MSGKAKTFLAVAFIAVFGFISVVMMFEDRRYIDPPGIVGGPLRVPDAAGGVQRRPQ